MVDVRYVILAVLAIAACIAAKALPTWRQPLLVSAAVAGVAYTIMFMT